MTKMNFCTRTCTQVGISDLKADKTNFRDREGGQPAKKVYVGVSDKIGLRSPPGVHNFACFRFSTTSLSHAHTANDNPTFRPSTRTPPLLMTSRRTHGATKSTEVPHDGLFIRIQATSGATLSMRRDKATPNVLQRASAHLKWVCDPCGRVEC